jgi:hypothetical protein
MPTCAVCGGNITPLDQSCPYCGKTQLHLGGGSQDASEWDLLTEDSPSGAPAEPPTASDTSLLTEDWMLPEDVLDPQHPPPAADVGLPPWAPVVGPAPAAPEPSPFEFTFDLEEAAMAAPPEPPPPVPSPPAPPAAPSTPAWLLPEADLGVPVEAAVISPVPVTPVPVTPVPVTPVSVTPIAPAPPPPPPVIAPPPVAPAPPAYVAPPPVAPAPPRDKVCPACNRTYPPNHNDSFCDCGTELIDAPLPAPPPPPVPPTPAAAPQRPPVGTRCLVLYGPDKQPVQYFALDRDATLVGRLDPASGSFPEIDVGQWVDHATARKVSRRHALILRSRGTNSFALRALPGNTGTQVEKQMLAGSEEVALAEGTRVILGGAVRFKFEVM